MRVAIVEDESPAAEKLVKELSQVGREIKVDAILKSVKSAIEYFKKEPELDLVFMDVELSDGTSFDILEKVEVSFPLIFITAYDQYWQKALTLNGIDYLMKPISLKELEIAVSKYVSLQHHFSSKINDLLKYISGHHSEKNYKKKFLIRKGRELVMIESSNIAYFKASQKMTLLVNKDERKFIVDDSLTQIEQQLDPSKFKRVHRSFLINIDYVHKMKIQPKGRVEIIMINDLGESFVITQEKSSDFKSWLEGK